MNGRVVVTADSVPSLAAHMRLRFDSARSSWTIQAPERAFVLDEIAHAIVQRCDGGSAISVIVEDLCRIHADAPRELVTTDVLQLVQSFVDKGVMAL